MVTKPEEIASIRTMMARAKAQGIILTEAAAVHSLVKVGMAHHPVTKPSREMTDKGKPSQGNHRMI
jgi:hypothetical protein